MYTQMGSFELKVKRSIAGSAVAPAYAPAPAAAPAAADAAPAGMQSMEMPPSVEDTVDESLVYVNSPKVRASTPSVPA